MALCKTYLNILARHSRLFSAVAQRATQSKMGNKREIPALVAVEGASNLSNEKWTSLRKEVLEFQTYLKTPSPDVPIMQFCLASKNLDLGRSYMKYLKENKAEISTALVGKYFQLLFHNSHSVADADKDEILAMYDKLRIKHPLLDGITAEYCILALSLTERWRETVELLEMIKLSSVAISPSYSAIIIAAFRNKDPELGWKYLNECAKAKKAPNSDAYVAYVDYCSKNFKESDACVEEIGKLFNFIAEHDLMPYKVVIDHVKNTFETCGWVGNFVKLSSQGVCRHCNHALEPLKLSESDFSHLCKTVLDKVLIGDNVYYKTSPFKLKKFVNFINKTKPYNVVIDGLNVAYKKKNNTHTTDAKQLATVVRYFLDKNQVVLVLGRKYMLRSDQQAMNFIKKNAFLFLTDNLSADDPCLLYATLASGPEARFVSNDLMRQHKFTLQDVSLGTMFKRWQMSHQFSINKKDKMSLIPPLSYLPVAQRSENCWHVPYRLEESSLTESYEPPSDWLCLERPKSRR